MQLDVRDYILKPLDPQEICAVLLKIKRELDLASAGYSKNMDILLSLRKDPGCIQVVESAKKVVDTLVIDNDAAFTKYCRQWRLAMQAVNREYLPLLVFDMMDSAYTRLAESGITLAGDLKQENVLCRIGMAAKNALLEEARVILQEIYQELKYKKSTAKESVIDKAKSYIDEHLSENFGVEELAFYVNLNRSYFSRAFKDAVGETVKDYLLRRRMEKAIQFIKEGKYSTEVIAGMVGYSDVKYFQRVFKEYTGYTVREYRNLLR